MQIENTQHIHEANSHTASQRRMTNSLCAPFGWQLFKHIHSSQERLFPAPQTGSQQSLRTQSAEPGSAGLYVELQAAAELSLGLINSSRAGPAHSVTGLDVHALPCSWACCRYGPNQHNHSSCRDILSRTGSLFDIMLMPNFEMSSCSVIEPNLFENAKSHFSQTPHNPKPLISG